jgi:hypothetical protein
MLYVEDVFEAIALRLLSANKEGFDAILNDHWRRKFIESVFAQIERDRPLSTEQAKIVLSIIKDVEAHLVRYGDADQEELSKLFVYPRYRHEPYQSTIIPKEVRHVGSNILAFRFKYNTAIIADIRNMQRKTTHMPAYFNREHKVWIVPVTHANLAEVKQIMREYKFTTDEATDRWLNMAKDSCGKPSTFKIKEGIVVAKVNDNEIMGQWMQNALGAEPI